MKSVQYMGMVVENRAVLGYDKRKSCSTWVSEKKIVQYMGMRKENGAVHGYEERKSCSTWVWGKKIEQYMGMIVQQTKETEFNIILSEWRLNCIRKINALQQQKIVHESRITTSQLCTWDRTLTFQETLSSQLQRVFSTSTLYRLLCFPIIKFLSAVLYKNSRSAIFRR